MKTFFSKSILIAIITVCSGLIFANCSKDETVVKPEIDKQDIQDKTRSAPGWHWKCTKCKLLNGGWNSICVYCGTDYSGEHDGIIMSFIEYFKDGMSFKTTIDDADLPKTVKLQGKFPVYYPTPWYETTSALRYYNDLKKSSAYLLVPGYAQDVDYAWYRTVRCLYPGKQDITQLERAYTKFLLGDGRRMSAGLKDGTKAALDAFKTCRNL